MTTLHSNGEIARRFGASAASYDGAAHVQARIARDLAAMVTAACPEAPPQVLEIGAGTGLLTRQLRDRWPSTVLQVVDPSGRMLEQCRRALGPGADARFHAVDFLDLPVAEAFPLIVSNAALHWIDPIEQACAKLGTLCMPGGRFLATIMVDGTLRELREARRRVAPKNLPSTRLPSPRRVNDGLERNGFRILEARTETIAATYPNARAFLSAIHRTGVTAGPVSRGSRPLTRGELNRLVARYDASYPHNASGVTATYVVHFLSAVRELA